MDKFRFIKLNAVLGRKSHPIWFRLDLITRIAVNFNGQTIVDYLEKGPQNDNSVYTVKETPEDIIALIEQE